MRENRTSGNDGGHHRGPPSWVEKALRQCLPKGIVGESILGDLREEFRSDFYSKSPGRALVSYIKNAVSVGLRFAGRTQPSPPGDQTRKEDSSGTMSALWHDLHQALRLLIRKPGLTLVAVLSLGLGIGANTAIFSLVNTILLKPLPYPDSHELVEAFRIDETVTGLNPTLGRVSNLWAVPYEVHRDWLEMGPVFEAGGGYATTQLTLQEGETSTGLIGARMTSGAFQALEIDAALGRTLLPEDDEIGAPPVAVLSYGLWQSQFGGDPGIIGTQLHLDDEAHTILGVMPQGFAFPNDMPRIWISFSDDQKTSPVRNGGYLKVVARLSPGISLEQARREMDAVSLRIGELHPEEAEPGTGPTPVWWYSRSPWLSFSFPVPASWSDPWRGFSPSSRASKPRTWPWPT